MNYHTNLLPSPVKGLPAEKETVLISNFVTHPKAYLFFKRAFDIFFSLFFVGFVLSWLIPIIGLLILVDSRGPIFFVQRRIGKNGLSFSCLKFRTMIVNDEADEKPAEENDYRITIMGKFLRRTNLDELPQFINVLIGDMSIIGPRPHMLSDCTRFSFVIPAYKFRTVLRPGITGLAQVKGFHGPTINYDSIFNRYRWDSEYIRHAGFGLDFKIMSLTFFQSIANIIHTLSSFFAKSKRVANEINSLK